jgi:SAM-dependent methyltransferase
MYRLKKMAGYAKGKILDIGYAAQPNIYLNGDVYGLDLDTPVIIPQNYKGNFVHDATRLDEIKERFDTILAGEIIEHLDNPQAFLSGCYSILKPGGYLVISTPNPYHPPMMLLESLMIRRYYYDEGHVNIFLPRFLIRLMERFGFDNVRLYSGGVEPPFVKFDMPCPYPLCELNIYIGQKPVE